MTKMRNFIFDFIVSNINFFNPKQFKLCETEVNVKFLDAKLKLTTSNEEKFREGKSFEFKKTQNELKYLLCNSCIKVEVQTSNHFHQNEKLLLASYEIKWQSRLFEKLKNENFHDYSQLEYQDIVLNGQIIGCITMGFQIKAIEASKYEVENFDDNQNNNDMFSSKIDSEDMFIVLGDDTRSEKNNMKISKFFNKSCNGKFDCDGTKYYLSPYKDVQINDNIQNKESKNSYRTSEKKNYDLLESENILSKKLNLEQYDSNISVRGKRRFASGGRWKMYEPSLPSYKNKNLFKCLPQKDNCVATKLYAKEEKKSSKKSTDFCSVLEKMFNENPTKELLKRKNSMINKILKEYEPSDGKSRTTYLCKAPKALRIKYGKKIIKARDSKHDPECLKKKKKARFTFIRPKCLNRKPLTTHGCCQQKAVGVPKNMGWLWSKNKEMVSRGWKPGAISYKIKKLMSHFLKDFPADTLPVFRHDKKFKLNSEPLVQKPTLRLKKFGKEYTITMRPLKPSEDIMCSADPYLNMSPIKFTIKKKPCHDDEETDEEFDVEFTPPAGLIKQKLLKRPIKACKETQYLADDINFAPGHENLPQKYIKMMPNSKSVTSSAPKTFIEKFSRISKGKKTR